MPAPKEPRFQELEHKNATLTCQVLELETELKQMRETAFSRLSENVEMRNRRAKLKQSLQQSKERAVELEEAHQELETKHEEQVQELMKELLATKDELASERRKNAGLKDMIVRITGQRDDALTKLAGIRQMTGASSPETRDVHTTTLSAKSPNTRRRIQLSDALTTPYIPMTFDQEILRTPQRSGSERMEESPMSTEEESTINDLQQRNRRFNSLKKLPTIPVPQDVHHPICEVSDNLDERLSFLSKSKIFNTPYFLNEMEVEFVNPFRQHGYILRPTLVLEPTHNRWAPYTIETFESDFPNIFELFVRAPRGWQYRGTYRRTDSSGMDLPNLTVGEYLDLPATAKAQLLDQVLRLTTPKEIKSLSDPLASNEVQAQCIGLQCIGFNTELYEALVAFQSPDERPSMDVIPGTPETHSTLKSAWDAASPQSGSSSGGFGIIRRLSKLGQKRGRTTNLSLDDDSLSRKIKQIRAGRFSG